MSPKIFKRRFRVPVVEVPHHTRIENSGDYSVDNKRDIYPKYSDAKGVERYDVVYHDDYCIVDLYATNNVLQEIAKFDDVQELNKKEKL